MKNCARIKKNKMTWKGKRMYEKKKNIHKHKKIYYLIEYDLKIYIFICKNKYFSKFQCISIHFKFEYSKPTLN